MSSDFDRQADDAIEEGAGVLLRSDRGSRYTMPRGSDQRVVVMEEKNRRTITIRIVDVSTIRVIDGMATLIQDGEPVEGYTGFPIAGRVSNVRRV